MVDRCHLVYKLDLSTRSYQFFLYLRVECANEHFDAEDLEEKNKCIIFAVEFIGMDWLRSSTE